MQESITGNIAIILGVIALVVTLWREAERIREKRKNEKVNEAKRIFYG